jgi:hypothetical protein
MCKHAGDSTRCLNAPVADDIPHWVVKAELAAPDLLKQRWLVLAPEWRVPTQQDEQHHASRPHVNLSITQTGA